MVAGFYRTQNGSFISPKLIGIHFTFISKIAGDISLTKMPAELSSTEKIFTETSRLVPLLLGNILILLITKKRTVWVFQFIYMYIQNLKVHYFTDVVLFLDGNSAKIIT